MILFALLWITSLGAHQTLCLFAPHVDLQKLDEIMLYNTKIKVLKPTVHIARNDIDFKDQRNFPARKFVVDRDGLSHYWISFEERRSESLRKALLNSNAGAVKQIKDSNAIVGIVNATNDNKKLEVKKKPRYKRRRKKKVVEIPETTTETIGKSILREDKKKVRTTFFCPFFGVVTMISYLD